MPPFGGGVVKLIVMPMIFIWVVILGGVYVRERIRVRNESQEDDSKRNRETLRKIIEKDEGEKV
jgi:hypothetical protein